VLQKGLNPYYPFTQQTAPSSATRLTVAGASAPLPQTLQPCFRVYDCCCCCCCCLPQRSPVADRRPRFRFASAILFLDSRSRNLKPKPQALNCKKKSPPPAVRARPSSKAKPRRRARRLRLRLRFVNEASPCARNPSQPSQPSLVGPLRPRNLSTAGQTLNSPASPVRKSSFPRRTKPDPNAASAQG
jgi:hypothetical protein